MLRFGEFAKVRTKKRPVIGLRTKSDTLKRLPQNFRFSEVSWNKLDRKKNRENSEMRANQKWRKVDEGIKDRR